MPDKKRKPKIYSHSRLSTFEQCPLKFKYRYIDKIIPEVKETIESHLGKTVHETLEWLYLQIKENKMPSIEQLISYYSGKWEERYNPDILIVKEEMTVKDYFNKGVQFIVGYYTKNQPFDDNTIEVEKKINIDLDDEGNYKIVGFIDRLSHNKEKDEYEIHDYKTANNLPMQKHIENDRQLALYSIAIKELFGKEKKVCLTWHYLAHNKKICSSRTDEQLEKLKNETLDKIKKIESTETFPYNKSILCNWCEYKKEICPAWNNGDDNNYKGYEKGKQMTLDFDGNGLDEERELKDGELDIW